MWFNSETRATTRGKGTAVELEAEKFLQKKVYIVERIECQTEWNPKVFNF